MNQSHGSTDTCLRIQGAVIGMDMVTMQKTATERESILNKVIKLQVTRAFQLACSMWCSDCVVLDINLTSTMFQHNTKLLDVVTTSI